MHSLNISHALFPWCCSILPYEKKYVVLSGHAGGSCLPFHSCYYLPARLSSEGTSEGRKEGRHHCPTATSPGQVLSLFPPSNSSGSFGRKERQRYHNMRLSLDQSLSRKSIPAYDGIRNGFGARPCEPLLEFLESALSSSLLPLRPADLSPGSVLPSVSSLRAME